MTVLPPKFRPFILLAASVAPLFDSKRANTCNLQSGEIQPIEKVKKYYLWKPSCDISVRTFTSSSSVMYTCPSLTFPPTLSHSVKISIFNSFHRSISKRMANDERRWKRNWKWRVWLSVKESVGKSTKKNVPVAFQMYPLPRSPPSCTAQCTCCTLMGYHKFKKGIWFMIQ